MTAKVFRASQSMGRTVRGLALVAPDGFSARYDLDRVAGVFSRPSHKLAGQSYVGKILILETAKGGVASAWMLHEMTSRGVMPLAMVFNSVNPILAQGAALADLPMLAGFDDGYHRRRSQRQQGGSEPEHGSAHGAGIAPPRAIARRCI